MKQILIIKCDKLKDIAWTSDSENTEERTSDHLEEVLYAGGDVDIES